MFRFESPEIFYYLLIIPAAVILFAIARRLRRRALERFGETGLVSRLMPEYSASRPVFKLVLWLLAIALLVLGAANPQVGSKLVKARQSGVDMMICLDVSNSMLAQDIRPNRLENAKLAISKLIEQMKGDRIGIVVFAGKGYVQLPITSDYAAAKMFLANIHTGLVPTQGTAIADAIRLAVSSFKSETKGRAIIIITDGEDHEGNVLEEAGKAAAEGIRIYTVGIGSPEGAPIPIIGANGQMAGFRKDAEGNTIMTRLDEVTLQKIASAGEGIYIRSVNTQQALRKIREETSKLEQTEFDTRLFSEYDHRFFYFLWAGLAVLVAEMLVAGRKSRWLGKIKLFER